jgi:hypothetical protein
MKYYVLSILAAILLAAVTEKLAPPGEGGRMTAHVRFLAGLFIILSLLSPLRLVVEGITSASENGFSEAFGDWIRPPADADYRETFGQTLTTVSRAEGEAWVTGVLNDRFSIPPEGCVVQVECTSDGETVAFSEVRIALTGSYALRDPHPIEDTVTEALGCPCHVTVMTP